LRVQAKPERLVALLRANQYLLIKIQSKRRNLARLVEKLRNAATTAVGLLAPVYLEMEQFDQQGHTLFAELLARKRQPRGAVRAIGDIYMELQHMGLLSFRSLARPTKKRGAESGEPIPNFGWDDPPPLHPDGEGSVSARRPGEGVVGQSVRGLFLKLAEALHPDKVQVEEEKERRTEAMKEITRAYQDGDLARLLELERTWMVGGELSSASEESDELERRLATLERTNEALRAQLDHLTGELKELRRSPQAELWSQAERAAKGSGVTPVEWMVQDASAQLEHLRELVGFITSFRDGQIDLDAFLRGPSFLNDPEDSEDDLMSLLCDLTQPPRRSKKRGHAAATPEDCPF
jgi:uncharacterized coiled-coil protein SlyX